MNQQIKLSYKQFVFHALIFLWIGSIHSMKSLVLKTSKQAGTSMQLTAQQDFYEDVITYCNKPSLELLERSAVLLAQCEQIWISLKKLRPSSKNIQSFRPDYNTLIALIKALHTNLLQEEIEKTDYLIQSLPPISTKFSLLLQLKIAEIGFLTDGNGAHRKAIEDLQGSLKRKDNSSLPFCIPPQRMQFGLVLKLICHRITKLTISTEASFNKLSLINSIPKVSRSKDEQTALEGHEKDLVAQSNELLMISEHLRQNIVKCLEQITLALQEKLNGVHDEVWHTVIKEAFIVEGQSYSNTALKGQKSKTIALPLEKAKNELQKGIRRLAPVVNALSEYNKLSKSQISRINVEIIKKVLASDTRLAKCSPLIMKALAKCEKKYASAWKQCGARTLTTDLEDIVHDFVIDYMQDNNLDRAKGRLWEIIVSWFFVEEGTQQNEFGTLEKINHHVKHSSEGYSREYDVITSKLYCECKNVTWSNQDTNTKIIQQLKEQQSIARSQPQGRKLLLISRTPIPPAIVNQLDKPDLNVAYADPSHPNILEKLFAPPYLTE